MARISQNWANALMRFETKGGGDNHGGTGFGGSALRYAAAHGNANTKKFVAQIERENPNWEHTFILVGHGDDDKTHKIDGTNYNA